MLEAFKRIRAEADAAIKQLEHATPTPAPAPKPTPTPEPTPSVLWSANHAAGNLGEWGSGSGGGLFVSGGGAGAASTTFKRSGTHSARLRLQNVNGDQGARLFRWAESQKHPELFYRVYLYLPQRYTAPNWWNIFQFKSKTSSKNDSFFQLNIMGSGDAQRLSLFNWQTRQRFSHNGAGVPVGKWFCVEAYYKSAGDRTGAITVWQDGVELFKQTGVQTRYADGDSQWSVNNYTDRVTPSPCDLYIDDAAISLSRIGAS